MKKYWDDFFVPPEADQFLDKVKIDFAKSFEVDDKFLFWDMRFGQLGIDPDNSPFIWCYELTPNNMGEIEVKRIQPNFKNMGKAIKVMYERVKGN